MARPALASVVAALATVALVASPAPAAASAAGAHGAPYAVGMRSYTFVDTSRPTAPNGTYLGAPSRTVPTLLLYPAQGDPAAPDVANAPPVEHGKGFPLLVFSHGFGASGPAYRT